uniref:glycoside hydrolase family 5 protein n=1 Tax=uncultured Sphingomonas sp. TaxID=158754 RepID=UPI0025FE5DA0|nr:glycoside hydrolase family 5 protein [uncultured Sphingomonas sp.]
MTTEHSSSRKKAARSARRPAAYLGLAGLACALTLGVSMKPLASARVPANPPPPVYYGVNLASGSFGPKHLPGLHGRDYLYPTGAIAEPFKAMGMNTIRLPVLWERLQHQPMGRLDPEEIGRLDKAIAELGSFKLVIIDVHNYAKYHGVALDQPGRSGAMLADLWTRLAERYKSNGRVAFGIMNEPDHMDAAEWRKIADQTVDAIRRTGARNLVLVPGTRWTGGHSWNHGGPKSNAATMSGFVDPGRNFIYEIHQYLDDDSSGTKKECVGRAGRQRLEGVTRWLREEKAKAFLGEFGTPPTPKCLADLDDMLAFLRENGDVWLGWTYWAGGDWWGDDPFSIQPHEGRTKPQSEVLKRHIVSYRAAASR